MKRYADNVQIGFRFLVILRNNSSIKETEA